MLSKEKLLNMIVSDKSSDRYDAVEWIRISQESSPDYIYALQKATHDSDPDIAQRACLALESEVHHKMAIQMALEPPYAVPETEALEASGTSLAEIHGTPATPPEINTMLREIRSWGV